MRAVFGEVAACRSCSGTGRPGRALTRLEQRERDRVLRKFRHRNVPPPPLVCFECDGKGYLPVKIADMRKEDRHD